MKVFYQENRRSQENGKLGNNYLLNALCIVQFILYALLSFLLS